MFSIVHPLHTQTLHAIVEPGSTIYTGSIIAQDTSAPGNGLIPLPVAAGAANVTNLDIPWGVCIGNNNSRGNIVSSTTYNAEYITSGAEATWHDNTTIYRGVEGPWPKADGGEYVKFLPITAETVLRGSIFNAAVGTAPTVVTVSTGSGTDGLDCTTGAADAATVADYGCIYMRSGANKGVYRVLETASSTVHTFTPAMPADIAVGDTAVVMNMRPFGTTKAYIDSTGLYFDCSAALTDNYLFIDVLRLDLSEPGNEYVEFRFNPINFNPVVRADTTS